MAMLFLLFAIEDSFKYFAFLFSTDNQTLSSDAILYFSLCSLQISIDLSSFAAPFYSGRSHFFLSCIYFSPMQPEA